MKLKKYELCILVFTLLVITFCSGYFIGRQSTGHDIRIEVSKSEDVKEQVNKTETPVTESKDSSNAEEKININTASAQELEELPGIGETLAERIIEYRETYGSFSSKEKIKEVYGIGNSIFEQIENYITVE